LITQAVLKSASASAAMRLAMRALLLADAGAHALDQTDDFLRLAVGVHERVDQVLLAHLVAAAFDHHDGVLAGGHHELDVGLRGLLERREGDELTVDARDAQPGDRAVPRDVGDVQRGARGAQRDHVRRVLLVGGEHGRDDLRVLLVAVREQRAQRAIHHARGEHLVVAQAAFTLEEAARDLAGGVRLFDVLTGEREEVEAGTLFARHHGHEHDALAVGGEHGAVGELREAAGLERERTTTDGYGFSDEHRMLALLGRDLPLRAA
jgi:hypothetical protein